MLATKIPSTDLALSRDWTANPLWKTVRYHWYWFAISPLLSLLLAWAFLRYQTPHYTIKASLLVRDDSRGSDFNESALLEELGLPNATSSVENEIEILRSRTLLSQVVADLHLTTQYFASGHLKTTELYEKTPYKITLLKPRTAKPTTYHIERRTGNTFTVRTPSNIYKGTFGIPMALPHGLSIIDTTRFKPASHYLYSFKISTEESVLDLYTRVLNIHAPNKTASLVNLSWQDVLPRKGEAILSQLIARYMKASIAEKNKVADNTIAFINQNLQRISSELAEVETSIEHFRKHHRVIDATEDGRQILERFHANASEEKELAVRMKIVELLAAHLRAKPTMAIPSALYPREDNFADLVTKYNDMLLSRVKALSQLSPGHPDFILLEEQISVLRNSLFDAIQYQKQELALSIAAIRTYGKEFDTQIARVPEHQRAFLAQSREQGIQQELYLFLLKKRMETAISRSANIANARIVDPPKASTVPVYPNRQLTMLVALLAGILAPAAVLYLGEIFNNKISSKEDILRLCDVPVIGEISQHSPSAWFQRDDGRSLVKEQFRSLRTNIQFITGMRHHNVLLLTSAMANEGKSFIAMHLAQSLALACKKVLLIDFNLRKPSLATLLNLKPEGVTEYIALERGPLIQQCGNGPPFDFLAAGAQYAETGEVMLSPKVASLISTLKTRYDFVLLDSPPVGLVADARLLGKHADITLYVVRQHFTFLHQLADLQELRKQSQLPDLYVVLNGMRDLRRYQYHYY